jgi:predicted membrane channel-forming protein YqfA (hemolysin III family)
VKRPFTLPYAKEQTPEPIWALPIFLQVNMTIASAWAGAFGVMTIADLAALLGFLSLPLAIAIGLLALIGAIVFSVRYPSVVRKRFGLPG